MSQDRNTLIDGAEVPNPFSTDQIALRRNNSGSGNPYDPESLLTGREIEQGFTYDNSRRSWASESAFKSAMAGNMTTSQVLLYGPRVPVSTERSLKEGERLYRTIQADGETWHIVFRGQMFGSACGWRIIHGDYTEWPVLLGSAKRPVLRFAKYRNADEHSMDDPNRDIPLSVREAFIKGFYHE